MWLLTNLLRTHGKRTEPARHAIEETIEILRAVIGSEGADLGGFDRGERACDEADHVDAEAGIVFAGQPFGAVNEKAQDMLRIAGCARGIDRHRQDLVVGEVEKEVVGLGAEAIAFELARQVSAQGRVPSSGHRP